MLPILTFFSFFFCEGGIGGIALTEVLSLAHSSQLALKYTHSSPKCLSCRVSHVNTVGYGLSERKQVKTECVSCILHAVLHACNT